MSEYQYYEFQAIDRPLTKKQAEELRSYSSRARITATSFVNHYDWGDFKGDEDLWMQKYFDVFIYFACWGTRVLKIALPSRLLGLKTLRPFRAGDCFEAYEKNGRTVITFRSEDEEHGDWDEDSCTLAPLVPTRSQLVRGDLRALYIGWLLCVQSGEVDDGELEPPVPPGLADCSGYIQALAEFLRIDSDLLCVAAKTSAALPSQVGPKDILTWVEKLPLKVKDRALVKLIAGNDLGATTELLQRFNAEHQQSAQIATPTARLRTAGYLLQAARRNAAEQEKLTAERRARRRHTRKEGRRSRAETP